MSTAAAPLVSSCSAAINPYKTSMQQLLRFVGLDNYGAPNAFMSRRSSAETAAINSMIAQVSAEAESHREKMKGRLFHTRQPPTSVLDAINGGGGGDGPPTIYLSFEESLEWRAFLAAIPPAQRHAATVRRRLSVNLWSAHARGICLYCWFPSKLCFCQQLDAYRAALPASALDAHLECTMLLHCEELMRSTNSGHVAAYILGAPIRVWGVAADDAFLQHLPAVEQRSATELVQHLSLYPESGAPLITSYIRDHFCPREETSCDDSVAPGKEKETVKHRVHLILSDSTWGQALSLNRHIPRSIPRVLLNIEATYEPLFYALRKQTRESGVSTLEATTMAMEQCITAMGHGKEAVVASDILTTTMREFVDLRCLLKFAEAEFAPNGDVLDDIRDRRDAARKAESNRRTAALEQKIRDDKEARCLLLPPVLNYCYVCDRVIGWHRMPEHVLDRTHRTLLVKNPTAEPSPHSRTVVVPDFSRPPRKERHAALVAGQGSISTSIDRQAEK